MSEDKGMLVYQPLLASLRDEPGPQPWRVDAPDARDGSVYAYDEELKLALEVALATGRPLLLRGLPGGGQVVLRPVRGP